MIFEADYTTLVYGYSGAGKSHSLGYLPMEKTAFINAELKPPSFRGAKNLYKYFKVSTIKEVQEAIMDCINDEKVEFVVFDSISMLADKIMYMEFIENAPIGKSGKKDTQTGWGNYKTFFNQMITVCKKSSKSFIFTALAMDIEDEQDKFEKRTVPKIQGSLKESISSEFTTVLYASSKLNKDKKIVEYTFQTRKTPENWYVEAKSPDGMFEEDYIPNNMAYVIEKQREFYN
jgi:hypothetical protein